MPKKTTPRKAKARPSDPPAEVSEAARLMVAKRWRRTSKAARKAHSEKMLAARNHKPLVLA